MCSMSTSPMPTMMTDIGRSDASMRAHFAMFMSENTPVVNISRTKYCCVFNIKQDTKLISAFVHVVSSIILLHADMLGQAYSYISYLNYYSGYIILVSQQMLAYIYGFKSFTCMLGSCCIACFATWWMSGATQVG